MKLILLLTPLLYVSCDSDIDETDVEIRRDTEVRVVSPTNGETVEST